MNDIIMYLYRTALFVNTYTKMRLAILWTGVEEANVNLLTLHFIAQEDD